jgi:hypothetical protein
VNDVRLGEARKGVSDFVPGYVASASSWVGAPRNTPAEIVDELNREINVVLPDSKSGGRRRRCAATPVYSQVAQGDPGGQHQGVVRSVVRRRGFITLVPCAHDALLHRIVFFRPETGLGMDGAAVQEESDYRRSVRVRSCIRPLSATVWPLALI